jgi:hypothetical protein
MLAVASAFSLPVTSSSLRMAPSTEKLIAVQDELAAGGSGCRRGLPAPLCHRPPRAPLPGGWVRACIPIGVHLSGPPTRRLHLGILALLFVRPSTCPFIMLLHYRPVGFWRDSASAGLHVPEPVREVRAGVAGFRRHLQPP